MRIFLKNIGKIDNAEVDIDGITVIAGENDTGKSTVGKVLDSMYNSTNNLEVKMKNARISRLRSIVSQIVNYAGTSMHISPALIAETAERVFEAEDMDSERWILEQFMDYISNKESMIERKMLLEELFDKIAEVKVIPDEVFTKVILSNYFNEIFNGNINNTEYSDTIAEVEIEIKTGKNSIRSPCKRRLGENLVAQSG